MLASPADMRAGPMPAGTTVSLGPGRAQLLAKVTPVTGATTRL